MRWTMLILNLFLALVFVCLAVFAIAAHRAAAYSTYRYFVINHAVVEHQTSSDGKPVDVEHHMQDIAGGGIYYFVLAFLAAGVCIINGFIFFFRCSRSANVI
jgi:hypothetical protein